MWELNDNQAEKMANILVIDDDSTSRKVLRAILESEGHTVLEAENGSVGLDTCKSHKVDIVITDIFMPEKEGVETVRELRRDYPEIQVIAVTGGGQNQMYEPLQWIRLLGVKHTYPKPYDRDVILGAVQDLLETSAQL